MGLYRIMEYTQRTADQKPAGRRFALICCSFDRLRQAAREIDAGGKRKGDAVLLGRVLLERILNGG